MRRALQRGADFVSGSRLVVLQSDEKTSYGGLAEEAFGKERLVHLRTNSKLARTTWNPLFPINHTEAMARDLSGRLRRRSWLVSKRRRWLDVALHVHIAYRNLVRRRFNHDTESPAQMLGFVPRRLTPGEVLSWRQDARRRSIHPLARGSESVAAWRAGASPECLDVASDAHSEPRQSPKRGREWRPWGTLCRIGADRRGASGALEPAVRRPRLAPSMSRSAPTGAPALDEASARRLILVRAFEEEDPEGHLLTRAERLRASERARAVEPPAERPGDEGEARAAALGFLVRRADALYDLLQTRFPAVGSAVRIAGSGRLLPTLAVPAALALGLAAEELGPDQHVNLLSAPIFGLFAWNLFVYTVLVVGALVRARPRVPGGLAALSSWFASPGRPWIRTRHGAERAGEEARALRRFLVDWSRTAARLHAERAHLALHLAALAFACGAIGGLYVRGLALEYTAGWQSTFLGAAGVHRLLSTLLGPASALTGIRIPGVEELAAMRLPGSGENAARWIHLYAVTAALLIGVPRALLALTAWLHARRLARALPIDVERDPAFLRLSSTVRGGGVSVVVLPYSTAIPREVGEALLGLAADLFGGRAQIDLREPLDYGDDPPPLERRPDHTLVVFNLAQSPEAEVHARFVEALGPAAGAPLVVLDEGSLRARLGSDDAALERIAERRKAWESALRDATPGILSLDLTRPIPDAELARARELAVGPAAGAAS